MSSRLPLLLLAGLLGLGFSCDETVNNGGVSLATTERISLDLLLQEADGECYKASLSGNGLRLCFESEATNLVPGDTNGVADAFVKDLSTGIVTRVSTGSAGQQANQPCTNPQISRDGNFVVFQTASDSPGFVGQGVNTQVYRKNLQTAALQIVSTDGVDPSFGHCTQPCLSDDGRYIAFVTKGNNINGVSGVGHVVRRDMNAGVGVFFVVPNASGVDASDPAISGAGAHLAYVRVGAVSVRQVFWRPVGGGELLASYDSVNAGQGNGHSSSPKVSVDGTYVVYASAATNTAPEDRTGISIFLRQMIGGPQVSTVVSVNSAGETSLDDCSRPWMTPDARYIAFGSKAGNLVTGDTNLTSDVFVHDRITGLTVRASVRTFGAQTLPGAVSDGPCLPDDGSFVVFESISPTLVDDDENGAVDLFLRSPLW